MLTGMTWTSVNYKGTGPVLPALYISTIKAGNIKAAE